MIRFLYPELFLLAIPMWFAYRRWGQAAGMTGFLRVALLVLLLLAIAGPQINWGGHGIDVIVVADRSRSLPADAAPRIRELVDNIHNNRRTGDRVGLATFGSSPAVESLLSEESKLGTYTKEILPDGSDLAEALHDALNLVQPNRPARILVLSDGEANGASPSSAARRALEMGVPVDYREFPRPRAGDVAVDSLQLPQTVAPREPFQYIVWVYSDREAAGKVTVLRDGEPIAQDKTERQFSSGMNRLLFRDLLEERLRRSQSTSKPNVEHASDSNSVGGFLRNPLCQALKLEPGHRPRSTPTLRADMSGVDSGSGLNAV